MTVGVTGAAAWSQRRGFVRHYNDGTKWGDVTDGRSRLAGEIRGARMVAEQAVMFSRLAESVQPVVVNGAAGIIAWRPGPGGQPFSVMSFTVRKNRITGIDVMRDPARLSRLDLTVLKD